MIGLQSQTYACVICRIAQKRNPHCSRGHDMVWMGRFWRAPKKTNIKAWQRVALGDKLWDDKAIERKAKREAVKRAKRDQAARVRARSRKPLTDELLNRIKYRRGRWEK